jgi:HK97 family phage major capsid protein
MVDYIAGKSAATFGDPTTGGYMAPSEFIAEVIHKVYDSGGIMALANVKSVTGMIAEIPYEASEGSSHWVGETETRAKDGNGAYGLAKIPMNTLISTLPLSNDLLNASAMNIESEMINSLTAKLQRDLESAFAVGTGVKQPLGLFSDSSIESIASGASGGLTSDALYSMIAEVPTATYANARFVMSNKILYNGFAKLKDLEGRYLLQPSLGQGLPMTLLGYPVSLTAFAPSTLTNGNIVAIFGDVRSAYVIGQGQSMTMVRDAITGYDNNMTYIKFNSRVGGQTVMPSSVVSMEVNAS